MLAQTLETTCPVEHGDFSDGQNLTAAQMIVQEAAIDVHKYPLLVAEASRSCRSKLTTKYLNNRDVYSDAYYLTEYEILGNVRRVATQALGIRAAYAAMPGIRETLESGFTSDTSLLAAEYGPLVALK